MTDAVEAARRIVNAHEAVEKAKEEKHPSFKDAMLALAYHELHASAREGALTVARALLSSRSSAIEECAAWLRKRAEHRKATGRGGLGEMFAATQAQECEDAADAMIRLTKEDKDGQ